MFTAMSSLFGTDLHHVLSGYDGQADRVIGAESQDKF